MNDQKKKKSPWPLGITIVYGSFVLFLLAWLLYATSRKVDLVTPDYYAQQIKYQEYIDKMERTKALGRTPGLQYEKKNKQLKLTFSKEDTSLAQGIITLFRPSNAALDFQEDLRLDENGVQLVSFSRREKGLWRLKVDWQHGENLFYHEEAFVVH